MIEHSSSPTFRESVRHTGFKMAVIGGVMLTAAGCALPERPAFLGGDPAVEQDKDAIDDYIHVFDKDRLAEKAINPSYRAEAVSLLENGQKVGSASLFRTVDGQISLVSVEHVARPFFDMPDVIKHQNQDISPSGETENKDGRAYVPGFGLLTVSGKPKFYDTPDADTVQDRFTQIQLTDAQQQKLAEAENAGMIDIPEASQIQPRFGEILNLPAANINENIPLLYLNQGSNGLHKLVPLVIVDEGLNPEKARFRLDNDTKRIFADHALKQQEQRKKNIKLMDISIEYARLSAVYEYVTDFDAKYANGNGSPEEMYRVSNLLPCHGESGAPLVDKDENTVGVLSRGEGFASSGIAFLRKNQGNSCLNTVSFDPVPAMLSGK